MAEANKKMAGNMFLYDTTAANIKINRNVDKLETFTEFLISECAAFAIRSGNVAVVIVVEIVVVDSNDYLYFCFISTLLQE